MDNIYNIKRSDFYDEKSFQYAIKFNWENKDKYPKKIISGGTKNIIDGLHGFVMFTCCTTINNQ